jgi:hypothetical protein
MLTLFAFFMILFLAWRAFVYYNEERVIACILAMLGCALFVFYFYVDYQKWKGGSTSAVATANGSPEVKASTDAAKKADVDINNLSLGQKANLCGMATHSSYHVERAPTIMSNEQRRKFFESGQCDQIIRQIKALDSAAKNGSSEQDTAATAPAFGDHTSNATPTTPIQ